MKRPHLVTMFAVCGLAASVLGCSSHRTKAAPPTRAAAPTCPLTGQAPPAGGVPKRPVLAVKVENLPQARPQYGLSDADVVYEEPVEGGITRFIVIYQCHDAPRIEPIRSARLIDPDLVIQFGAHPLFAYAGAIQPVVAKVDASPLVDVGIFRAPQSDYRRDPGRSAPHNLVSSTADLYSAGAAAHAPAVPPLPVFRYGSLLPGANPADSVRIRYPYSDVIWSWQRSSADYLRSYAGAGPAQMGEGGNITATNIVVMKMTTLPGSYGETVLALTGSGPAQVFRNGTVIDGTWNRPSLGQLTVLNDASGREITLDPGRTWIELVPSTVAVTMTP